MQSHPEDEPELDGPLAQAVTEINSAPFDDALVARCRDRALAFCQQEAQVPSVNSARSQNWIFPLASAAAILLVCNLLQAYLQRPSSNRQVAALVIASDGQRFYHFSDLRMEPASR